MPFRHTEYGGGRWEGPHRPASSGPVSVSLLLSAAPPGSLLWYDGSPPAHPRLHQAHLSPLLESGSTPRTLRPLIHSLRAVKSSAEVALMQAAGHISAQVGSLNPPHAPFTHSCAARRPDANRPLAFPPL